MTKFYLFTSLFFLSTTLIMADNNKTDETKQIDNNKTIEINSTKEDELKKQVKEQMKREEKYAKEQVFYQGDDYDLSSSEVNLNSLDKLKSIEPDYDFDMDDVYRDDL